MSPASDPALLAAVREARAALDRLAWMKPDRLDHGEDVRRIEKAAKIAAQARDRIDAAVASESAGDACGARIQILGEGSTCEGAKGHSGPHWGVPGK